MEDLILKDVHKTYGKGRTLVNAVTDVNLTLKNGEIILIMGPSGSGKTSLLSIAGGLLRPSSGEVILKGVNIRRLNDFELSKLRLNTTGFVFQAFNLLESLNAIENVEVPLNLNGINGAEARLRSQKMLDAVGLSHRGHFYPNHLSSGEKQKVAIARALVNNPEIILADEPTGNLDKASGKTVMTLLKTLVKESGKSAIIVTHDERIVSLADKVYWLEDGHLKMVNN